VKLQFACITHQTDIEYRGFGGEVTKGSVYDDLGKAGSEHDRIAQKSTAGPQVYTRLWSQGGMSGFRVRGQGRYSRVVSDIVCVIKHSQLTEAEVSMGNPHWHSQSEAEGI
jgi:hypothetical protein